MHDYSSIVSAAGLQFQESGSHESKSGAHPRPNLSSVLALALVISIQFPISTFNFPPSRYPSLTHWLACLLSCAPCGTSAGSVSSSTPIRCNTSATPKPAPTSLPTATGTSTTRTWRRNYLVRRLRSHCIQSQAVDSRACDRVAAD